ncbi:wd40 yvtn repeat-like-containing domain [Venturia nashicola]|uniref:Wd40 yvtn repeat-like-containing domain n=1 Tax=Venturia nashicola TaxID=86259 RepID=A0A4Z1NYB1_9PEZI|nr:wd40 yvtn repeat-like-containing domain [Venturia nashicola]
MQSPSASTYQQPSISSPLFSPAPSGPQPHHPAAVLSPNTSAMNTPQPESGNQTRATDLLSLLKFRPGAQAAPSSVPSLQRRESQNSAPTSLDATVGAANRSMSAADLVAGFTRKPSGLGAAQSPSALAPASSRPETRGEASNSSANPQDFLLKLLNQGAPKNENFSFRHAEQPIQSVEQTPGATMEDLAQDLRNASIASPGRGRQESPMHVFGDASAPITTFDAPPAAPAPKAKFTYVNPFEQLAASSPRNRTPNNENKPGSEKPQNEVLKHARDNSTGAGPAAKSRKVSADPLTSPPLAHPETVSEAVSGLGEVAGKQVEEALAQITSQANGKSEPKMSQAEQSVQEAAAEIKEELKDEATRRQMEAGMPAPMAKAFEETIAAAADADDDWEEAAEKDVRVFQFPMQPFVSIEIKKLDEPPMIVPADALSDIAKMKKDFDQIDRNLITASQQFMVYPLKNGGLRVIRQEDGTHKQIFSAVKERIFNVALSVSKKVAAVKETETVLATGVNGTIFWAPLANFGQDEMFGQTEQERGFLFPPVPTHDENTSGGQLKTRVKPTSRNPEFFAYGRGKSIYLISPSIARTSAYCDPETRRCDSEKYLDENSLKISTGKAGKDFIFSADDTVILSLDKVGRLKFWDIRELIMRKTEEVKTPLMTLTTCQPTEKSWPTSVMLLDKEKPMTKGIALRYVIVGMKQNHTLQIWDLTLGKPVQEINFPHDQESDGICSLAYHAKSGILVVGHPTRNSIYFMNISAPQYNLPPMAQARFINMLATKDATLPNPQSTIICSGIREFSLRSTTSLRSLDMLADPGDQFGEDAPLFVLYIMHSKGISEMRVTRPLLGWSESGKYINQVKAQDVGAISVSQIKELPAPVPGEAASVVSETPPVSSAATPSRTSAKENVKKVDSTPVRPSKNQTAEAPKAEQTTNGETKKKKKEKKLSESASQAASTAPSPFIQPIEVLSRASQAESSAVPPPAPKAPSVAKTSESGVVPTWATTPTVQAATTTSTGSTLDMSAIEAIIRGEFESLAQNLSEDRIRQEAVAADRQEGVLKVVSRTLHDNVEDSLSKVVADGLNKITLSPMKEVIANSVDRNLSTAISQTLKASIPRELEKALPGAVSKVLQDQNVLRSVAEVVTKNVTLQVEKQFSVAMRDTIGPSMAKIAMDAANTMSAGVKSRLNQQVQQAALHREEDNSKISELMKVIGGLQQTIQLMAEEQVKFQQQTTSVIDQLRSRAESGLTGSVPQTPASHQRRKTPEELERDEISALAKHDLMNATIKWMHSPRKIELFDEIFMHINPSYLEEMSALIILSVSAAVTDSLDTNILQRLAWLEVGLHIINPATPEITDVFPKVLEVMQTRLQQAYMTIAERNHIDPILRNVAALNARVQEMKAALHGR